MDDKKLAVINVGGGVTLFSEFGGKFSIEIESFGNKILHPLQWVPLYMKFNPSQLKTKKESASSWGIITPEIFLNFAASEDELKKKLKREEIESVNSLLGDRKEIKILTDFFKNGFLLIDENKGWESKNFSLKKSLFSLPQIDGNIFDLVIISDSTIAKDKQKIYSFRYSFDFLLPENLPPQGIFIEGNSWGWYIGNENELLLYSFSQDPPVKSFYFLSEGKLEEESSLNFPASGKIKKVGKGVYKIAFPLLLPDEKFSRKFHSLLCSILSGEEKKKCRKITG